MPVNDNNSRFEPAELEHLAKGQGRPVDPERLVAGIDEAGRGCLAGPVSIALVCLPYSSYFTDDDLPELDDSKSLSEKKRDHLWHLVRKKAVYSSVVHVNSYTIDSKGINRAIENAIKILTDRFIRNSKYKKPIVLIDGNYKFNHKDADYFSIIKGDSRVKSIAAASILAKVSRDRKMLHYARKFPDYGFEKHKGYGTRYHREMLIKYGSCLIHRKSYSWKKP